jgi:hypothetical protein
MRHTLLLPVLLAAMSGLLSLPCRAGGAIGQSSVSQAEAIRSATLGMLPGEVVTSSNCSEDLVDGSTLYTCDVQWGAPPAP